MLTKLLIIGGYGNFGGRLARLLGDETNLTLLIAGRSLTKATAFVKRHASANMLPISFDRNVDVLQQMKNIKPDIVVDASGPFQAYGVGNYAVAEAAISIGAHYLDLADDANFVHGIGKLDNGARAKEVFVLSGVSTCPALTMAVARRICSDFTSVQSIFGGIAPSPYAGMGESVVRAIASYAGNPVQRIRAGKLVQENTFLSTRDATIAPPGTVPLAPMRFSLIEVPDLQALGELPIPVDNTWFGVATQPGVYHRFLRMLAHLVKWRLLPSLRPLAALMQFVMNRLSWGEHRGGMFVEVRGTSQQGNSVHRSWHLIAEGDIGPTVPTLAVVSILRRHLAGKVIDPGARAATNALELDDYEKLFTELRIMTGVRNNSVDTKSPLFEKLLGNAWDALPASITALHSADNDASFSGTATVTRGSNIISILIGWFMGFPNAGNNIPLTVRISKKNDGEVWRRDFNGTEFSSELSLGQGRFDKLLCEKMGLTKIGMALVPDKQVLHYVARRWSFLGIPMPLAAAPLGNIYESSEDNRFAFHVEIKMPCVGHIVTYHGCLNIDSAN